MNKKCKLISGLTVRKIVKMLKSYFAVSEKHLIIQEMLEAVRNKRMILELISEKAEISLKCYCNKISIDYLEYGFQK